MQSTWSGGLRRLRLQLPSSHPVHFYHQWTGTAFSRHSAEDKQQQDTDLGALQGDRYTQLSPPHVTPSRSLQTSNSIQPVPPTPQDLFRWWWLHNQNDRDEENNFRACGYPQTQLDNDLLRASNVPRDEALTPHSRNITSDDRVPTATDLQSVQHWY